MTAVMQKIQEDAKKKEDEKWERKREVQVKKIKENGIYDKVSRIKETDNLYPDLRNPVRFFGFSLDRQLKFKKNVLLGIL